MTSSPPDIRNPNAADVIQVRQLTKIYTSYKKQPGLLGALRGLFRRQKEFVPAAKDITFHVRAGEFVGFLGPNGAGKTTTLKMLAGLLYPTSGTASVLGFIPWERRNEYRRQFALLLGQKNQLWWDLPAYESLSLNAKIYGLPYDHFQQTVDQLTSLLDVKHKLNTMVRELSLGERMKMELIASLLHQPKVLFLDEPTIGLDVVSQKTVREFLRHYNASHHTTILLTSHYMADIQELCRRVIIINHGSIFFDGQLSDIIDRFADSKLLSIQCNATVDLHPDEFAAWGELTHLSPNRFTLRVKRERVIPVCKQLLDRLPVQDIDIQEVPVEDIISQVFSTSK